MCLTKGETVFLDFCREQEITGFASVDREAEFQSMEEQQEEGGNVERMPCEDLLPAYVYNF